MIQTIEAVIDERGIVRLLEHIRLPAARRAFVTILEESPKLNSMTAPPAEEWNTTSNDIASLLRETAVWEAASEEDALKLDKLLAEKE